MQLEPAAADAGAAVLAEAFVDDPLWVVLYPDVTARRRVLGRFFRPVVQVAADRGSASAIGDPVSGVAVWAFPEKSGGSVTLRSISSFLPLLASSFPAQGLRALKVFGGFAQMRRRHLPEPHFYLETIGVAPAARGTGVASRLIRPMLDRADAERVGAWTETVTGENVGIYEHFGFQVVEQGRVDRLGLDLFGLVRRPAIDGP